MNDPIPGTILIIETGPEPSERLVVPLREAGFAVHAAYSNRDILAAIYAEPPSCIVLPYGMPGTSNPKITLIEEVKGDHVYGHLPVILTLAPEDLETIDWHRTPADDYLVRPVSPSGLLSRVRLCIARAQRDVNANPLTGLPGNITIIREAEQRLAAGIPFSMGYLDLDNFKPFNDKYGFTRGDEVLRMTARILVNALRQLNHPGTYAGHIGGDDFVFLTPSGMADAACKEFLRNFDLIVPNFYDDEDRNQGSIHSLDRRGNPQVFPLMTCSIAVVDTGNAHVEHIADISARTAEVKKFAKSLPGSNYLIDRRK